MFKRGFCVIVAIVIAGEIPKLSIMPPFLLLLAILVAVPLVEIYLLISVGRVIGAGVTVLAVIGTAVLGAWLLRLQGLNTIARVQNTAARGEIPAQELIEGLILLVTGALLLTPGFFTDAIGFLCLIPPIRAHLARQFLKNGLSRVDIRGFGQANPANRDRTPGRGSIIDGEFYEADDRQSNELLGDEKKPKPGAPGSS